MDAVTAQTTLKLHKADIRAAAITADERSAAGPKIKKISKNAAAQYAKAATAFAASYEKEIVFLNKLILTMWSRKDIKALILP